MGAKVDVLRAGLHESRDWIQIATSDILRSYHLQGTLGSLFPTLRRLLTD